MEEAIDEYSDLPGLASRWFPVISRTLKNTQIARVVCEKSLRGPPKTQKTEHFKSSFFTKNCQTRCTCGQKLHLRFSQNLEINFAASFLENRAFLKTAKPLELFAEKTMGPQRASQHSKNRELQKHFHQGKHKEHCTCVQRQHFGISRNLKINSRNSSLIENSKTA